LSTQDSTTRTATKPVLTTEDALAVLQAAMAKAIEIGVPMTVVVVDEEGTLKAFIRMEGTTHVTIDSATDKAYTAAAFHLPTHQLEQVMQNNPVWMASILKLPHITLVPAGYPLLVGQSVVGAIGTGGGTPEQDQVVAEAGAAAMQTRRAR
jgi:glc operon protein GlcG